MGDWAIEDILVTVRAYPNPSKVYREASCVAGITTAGTRRRLYPVPYRLMAEEEKFKKYDIVRVRVSQPRNDGRPDSRHVDLTKGIEIIGHVPTRRNWLRRNELLEPMRASSMEELHINEKAEVAVKPSLALIRPKLITDLIIESKEESDWSPAERAKLSQDSMFYARPDVPLEFVPVRFRYTFLCDDARCKKEHNMTVIDWEMIQSYRRWKLKYGSLWEEKFREKYFEEMLNRDLQLFVGTMSFNPMQWVIIGLYYPPLLSRADSQVPTLQLSLFQQGLS